MTGISEGIANRKLGDVDFSWSNAAAAKVDCTITGTWALPCYPIMTGATTFVFYIGVSLRAMAPQTSLNSNNAQIKRSVSIRCQGYIGDFVLGCHAKDMVALYSVMSDSDESGVTYTEVSSPFEGLSDIGSPRADDHEYLELPGMPKDPYVEAALQAPPSPDYVPGPKEPEQAPPSPDYVPGLEHADDEIVAEDQPYAEDASPTAQSPDYVPESDPEADPEEDDDEDPEEDPVDYSADGGDDGDDEDEPSEEGGGMMMLHGRLIRMRKEEEHTAFLPTSSCCCTSLLIMPHMRGDRANSSTDCIHQLWSDAEVAKLLAISTPPSSPLSPWSSPLPQILSPSLPLSPPSHVAEAASTSHSLPLPPPFILSPTTSDAPSSGIPPPLPISVPTSLPPLLLPYPSRREDIIEVTLPPRKRQDIDEIYTRLDDEQSQRQLFAGRLNMLFRDRRDMQLHRHPMETEARLSREAWRRSMNASDLVRGEVMSLRTTVLGQISEIRELHAADRRRQAETSKCEADRKRSAEMRELRTVDRTRQQQLIQTLTVMQSL
ncbi:hypothetical protein Tco_0209543 [Tanacetum coccineum]